MNNSRDKKICLSLTNEKAFSKVRRSMVQSWGTLEYRHAVANTSDVHYDEPTATLTILLWRRNSFWKPKRLLFIPLPDYDWRRCRLKFSQVTRTDIRVFEAGTWSYLNQFRFYQDQNRIRLCFGAMDINFEFKQLQGEFADTGEQAEKGRFSDYPFADYFREIENPLQIRRPPLTEAQIIAVSPKIHVVMEDERDIKECWGYIDETDFCAAEVDYNTQKQLFTMYLWRKTWARPKYAKWQLTIQQVTSAEIEFEKPDTWSSLVTIEYDPEAGIIDFEITHSGSIRLEVERLYAELTDTGEVGREPR